MLPLMSHICITSHGAVANTDQPQTAAIQAAIDTVATAGGGTVRIPPGIWLTGTLRLCHRLTLDLAPGAVLRGSTDIADYPPVAVDDNPQHNKDLQPHHLLLADGCEDLLITGGGTIDGNGPAFWDPPSNCEFYTSNGPRPSPMLEFAQCRNLRLQQVRIINSPGWTVHIHGCHQVRIQGIEIVNDLFGPNTDGIDITDSCDCHVSDCRVVAGDDAIVLKSLGGVNERIVVTNCILQTRCSALKLGANESIGTIRQVAFSNCVIHDSSRGLHLACMAGGTFEDISISNIICDTHNDLALVNPIHIDCSWWPKSSYPFKPGIIRRVRISGVTVRSDARIMVTAGPQCRVEDVILSDIHLHYPTVENEFDWARTAVALQFSPQTPEARGAQAAICAENIDRLQLRNISINWPADCPVPMRAVWGRHLRGGIIDCPLAAAAQADLPALDLEECSIRV